MDRAWSFTAQLMLELVIFLWGRRGKHLDIDSYCGKYLYTNRIKEAFAHYQSHTTSVSVMKLHSDMALNLVLISLVPTGLPDRV